MKNKIPPLDEIGKEINEIFQGLLSEELDGNERRDKANKPAQERVRDRDAI